MTFSLVCFASWASMEMSISTQMLRSLLNSIMFWPLLNSFGGWKYPKSKLWSLKCFEQCITKARVAISFYIAEVEPSFLQTSHTHEAKFIIRIFHDNLNSRRGYDHNLTEISDLRTRYLVLIRYIFTFLGRELITIIMIFVSKGVLTEVAWHWNL